MRAGRRGERKGGSGHVTRAHKTNRARGKILQARKDASDSPIVEKPKTESKSGDVENRCASSNPFSLENSKQVSKDLSPESRVTSQLLAMSVRDVGGELGRATHDGLGR